jgi:hypothetical protein
MATKPQLSGSNRSLVFGPRGGLTPRLTGLLIVGRYVTLTLTNSASCHHELVAAVVS